MKMKTTRSILQALFLGVFIQAPAVLAQTGLTSGMAPIAAGSFVMGDTLDGESDAPTGAVSVSAFYMDTNLVTSNLWSQVFKWAATNSYTFVNPGDALGGNYPIYIVDWFDAIKWCNARSQKAGLTPVYYSNSNLTVIYKTGESTNVYVNWNVSGYRLPTEAEWEKAARGGLVGQRFPLENTIAEAQANYYGNSFNAAAGTGFSYDLGPTGLNSVWYTNGPFSPAGVTSTVGYYPPNDYGLNDMAGNVYEWCWDWYSNSYSTFPLTDPHGPTSGTNHVDRGGGWNHNAYACRTANRNNDPASYADNEHGFRAVLPEVQFVIVSVNANPANEGSATGGGTFFSAGSLVTNTATPNSGYQFVNWTSNDVQVSTSPTYVLTANTSETLIANFTVAEYTITPTASPSAGGTVSGGGTLVVSNSVSVTASPNTGYTFTNWTVGVVQVSTNTTYTFSVTNSESLVANFTPINYAITVTANPGSDGSVSAGGTFAYGSLITNTATPNTGYTFSNWTVGGDVVSTVTNYIATVTGTETLVANFAPIDYTLTVIAFPSLGGTATGGGTYQSGTMVSCTATTNSGYQFVNWTINGSQVSIATNYVATLNSDETLVANFAPVSSEVTITLFSFPSAGGSVSGGGLVANGSLVTNIATTNAGYQFVNWTTNNVQASTNATYIFTASNNEVLVANFAQTNSTVTVIAYAGVGGTVANAGGTFASGSSVTNTATTNGGFQFVNWTTNGAFASASAMYSFSVLTNVALVANFTNASVTNFVTVIAYAGFGGAVANTGGTFAVGSSVANTALTNGGFQFANWTTNGAFASSNPTYSFTAATNVALIANFTSSLVTNLATVIAYAGVGGAVANSGGTFAVGASVTNTATTNGGFQFVNWTTNGAFASASAMYSFSVLTNVALVANFTNASVTNFVTVIAYAGFGGAVANTGGTFAVGSSVANTALTNGGFQFANWTTNGAFSSSSASYTFTAATNVAVVANFTNALVTNSATVIAYAGVGGTVANSGGTFAVGASVTNTATTNGGFQFVNWTTNGAFASASAMYSFSVLTNVALVANFTNASVTNFVTVIAYAGFGGAVANTGGTFAVGSSVANTALTNGGFQFANWTTNGAFASSSASYSFIASTNVALTANFTNTSVTITVIPYPPADGTAAGSGTFQIGSSVTNTATANSGYQFVNWTATNGTQASASATNIFPAAANQILFANFIANPLDDILTVIPYPVAGGTVSSGGPFPPGSLVTNTAMANPGYSFVNWTTNGIQASASNTYILTLNSNQTLVANFASTNYTVTVISYPSVAGAVTGGGVFPMGSLVTNTATPNAGYQFVNWTANSNVVSATSNYSFTVTNNVVLIATFAPVTYSVTATTSPNAGPAASFGGLFAMNSLANFVVTPNAGYEFLDWTINSNVVSASNSYNFAVTSNQTLVANFLVSPVSYTLTANASPALEGAVSGGGTFPVGSLVTNTAINSNGFMFIGWSGDASGTSNPLVVTLNKNLSITANFATSSGLTLTIVTNGDGIVSTDLGAKVLTAGNKVILTATPQGGNSFLGWSGSIETNKNPLTVTLNSSMVLQANFGPDPFLLPTGTFNGLFFNSATGVTEQTAGMLKGLVITTKGTYSGAILIAGASHSISGSFSGDGQVTNQISSKSIPGGALTLIMTLTSSNNFLLLTGTVSGTANGAPWMANLTAYFTTTGEPSGQYTLLISPDTNNFPPSSSPGGDGYALITDDAGAAKLAGALADGTAFSQTAPVSQNGYIPLYASLYGNKGLLLGWVNLNQVNTNGVGLTWIRPPTSGLYPSGFTNLDFTNQILLSPWSSSPAILSLFTNLSISATINGSNAVNIPVTTTSAGKVSGTSPSGTVNGAINPKTGLLTVTIGSGSTKVTGYGAILLNTINGGGYLVTKTNAQAIQLAP